MGRTLLIDADFENPSLDVMIGGIPSTDLISYFLGESTLHDMIFNPIETQENFYLIAGRSGSNDLAQLSNEASYRLTQEICNIQDFDYIVLDCNSRLGGQMESLHKVADSAIIFASNLPVDMTRAFAHIKHLKGNAPECPQYLVVNRVNDQSIANRTYEGILRACKTFLDFEIPFLGFLPEEPNLRESNFEQKSLLEWKADSPYIQNAKSIAAILTQQSKQISK